MIVIDAIPARLYAGPATPHRVVGFGRPVGNAHTPRFCGFFVPTVQLFRVMAGLCRDAFGRAGVLPVDQPCTVLPPYAWSLSVVGLKPQTENAIMQTQVQNSPAVSVFTFQPSFDLRTIIIDGNPWFVATDVCAALDVQNVTQAVGRLDDDERAMFNIGRQGEATVINESGLYSLVMGSRKPEAKKFKKWVTSEVLPSIRRTGSYTLPAPVEKRDYLTSNDMLNLKRLIWTISGHLRRHETANRAIWANLRRVTGAPSPARFEVGHLPVIEHELRRMFSIIRPVIDAIDNAEILLVKTLTVGNEGHGLLLDSAIAELHAAAKGERNKIDATWNKFFNSDSRALLERTPSRLETPALYDEPDTFSTFHGSL